MKPGIKEFTPAIPNDENLASFSHPLSFLTKKNRPDHLWVRHEGIPGLEGRDVKRAVFFAMLMEPILGRYLTKVRMSSTCDAYVTKYIPHLKTHQDFIEFFEYTADQLVQMRLPFICGVLKMIGESDFHAMNLGVVDEQFILFDTDYWGYFHPFEINYPVAEARPTTRSVLTHRQNALYGDEGLGPHAWPGSRRLIRGTNEFIKTEFKAPFDALYHRNDAMVQHVIGVLAAVVLPSAYVKAVAECLSERRDEILEDFVARFIKHQRFIKDQILLSWRFMAALCRHFDDIKSTISAYFESYNLKYQNVDPELHIKAKYRGSPLIIDLTCVTKKLDCLYRQATSLGESAITYASVIHLKAPVADNGLVHLTCVVQLIQDRVASADIHVVSAMKVHLSGIVAGVCDVLCEKLGKYSPTSFWELGAHCLVYHNFHLQYLEAAPFVSDKVRERFKQLGLFFIEWLEKTLSTITPYDKPNSSRLPVREHLHAINVLLAERYYINSIFDTYFLAIGDSIEEVSSMGSSRLTWLKENSQQCHLVTQKLLVRCDVRLDQVFKVLSRLKEVLVIDTPLLAELAKKLVGYLESSTLPIKSIKGLCLDFISLSRKLLMEGDLSDYAKAQFEQVNKATTLVDFDKRLVLYHVFTEVSLIPRPTIEQINQIEAHFFKLLMSHSIPMVRLCRTARVLMQQNIYLKRAVPFEVIQGLYFEGFESLSLDRKFDVITDYHRHASALAGYLTRPVREDYAALVVTSFMAIDPVKDEILFHSAKEPLYSIAAGHEALLGSLDDFYGVLCLSPDLLFASSTSLGSATPFCDAAADSGLPKALGGLCASEVPL